MGVGLASRQVLYVNAQLVPYNVRALWDAYPIRRASVADIDTVVHHRVAMFTDMGTRFDAEATARTFRRWVEDAIASELYRGWLVDGSGDAVVAGAGITVVPWPPGPRDTSGRMAFVYNVYTEPEDRGRGLGRRLMNEIHAWCKSDGIRIVGLAASQFGRPMYEGLGYRLPPNPYMFLALE